MSETGRTAEGFAKAACHTASHGRRTFHSDLLSENCAHGKFEAVPAAWYADPGIGFHSCG